MKAGQEPAPPDCVVVGMLMWRRHWLVRSRQRPVTSYSLGREPGVGAVAWCGWGGMGTLLSPERTTVAGVARGWFASVPALPATTNHWLAGRPWWGGVGVGRCGGDGVGVGCLLRFA